MSLFLRKECQSLLDNVELEDYHVQIDTDTKCLQIVGECGQVLTSIAGIRLSRMAPNQAEIEIALELFDAFLVKHASTFKEFVKASKKMNSLTIPEPSEYLSEAKVTKGYLEDWILNFNLAANAKAKIDVHSDGIIHMSRMTYNIVETPDAPISASLNAKEIKAIKQWMKGVSEYEKAREDRKKLLESLSSCEI